MKKLFRNSKHRRGFTLVELLVVIAIIAVLVAVSVTMVFRFRKAADKTVSLGNLRQLQTANVSYSADHAGRHVSPMDTVGTLPSVDWWRNPEYISQLKTEAGTFTSTGPANVSLPPSMMDPSVVRDAKAGSRELPGSYAYNTEGMRVINGETKGYLLSLVADPARSVAFFTADFAAGGVVNFANSANVSYRHAEKGMVVYYDSHAAPVSRQDVDNAQGGATGRFWDADPIN